MVIAMEQLGQIREYLLTSDRHACVCRELWNNGVYTYQELRSFIKSRKGHRDTTGAASPGLVSSPVKGHTQISNSQFGSASNSQSQVSTLTATFQPTAYTFVGMRCVFDDTKCAICLVRFANVRNDLLAYADVEGGLWVVRNIHSPEAAPVKAPAVHRRPITSLDWSVDNTYILTAAIDGLTVWDAAELCPVRTVATPSPSQAFTAAIFHPLSANLVVAGTAAGMVEAMNTSTGAVTVKVPYAKKPIKGVSVTAIECSPHYVFVGDSSGWLHLHKQDIPRPGQLAKLLPLTRVRIPATDVGAQIVGIQYLAFCTATGCAALLVTARDSTLAIVKLAHETSLEIHTRCMVAPMAREIKAYVCPLSMMHCDLPRVVMGSEETGVHIYNLSSIKTPPPRGSVPNLASNANVGRPLLVNTLKGHRAPVPSVSWAFDESLLASADCDGMCIVWERANS